MPDFAALDPAIEPFRPPAGFYMHGPVGCGKTMLMDVFVRVAPEGFKVK